MNCQQRLRCFSAILAAIFVVSLVSTVWTQDVAATSSNDLYFGILPEMRTEVLDDVQGLMSVYTIQADLNPDNGTIKGVERVRYRNRTGQTLDEVAFRLYPNAPYYTEGALTISDATVDNKAVDVELKVDDTAMVVKLPQPLKPQERVQFEFRFTT